ncbi:hypothetical protein [Nostoc sp.]
MFLINLLDEYGNVPSVCNHNSTEVLYRVWSRQNWTPLIEQ